MHGHPVRDDGPLNISLKTFSQMCFGKIGEFETRNLRLAKNVGKDCAHCEVVFSWSFLTTTEVLIFEMKMKTRVLTSAVVLSVIF